jgi:alkanesulfonate monooxygenase SsuD/methylene tetrahydromethanopterin reductase-like flavin-dependent oxidoreductase (luciferase family)
VDCTPTGAGGGPELRFGLLLTAVHGGSAPAGQQVEEHLELTRLAVECGFDLVIVGQHLLPERLRYYRPVPYLVWLATMFPTIRVATGVMLLPLLRPIDVAEEVATLDVLTGGRVVFGVGLGYTDREFAALGIARANRVARLELGLKLVLSLWSGERTEHHGIFGDFVIERPILLPIQRPHPPVWLAGQVPRAVRRAARIADAWYPPPFLSHAELRHLAKLHAAERAVAGRTAATQMPVRRELFIADNSRQAAKMITPYALASTKAYLELGNTVALAGQSAVSAETEGNIGDRFLLGSPHAIAAELGRLRDDIGMTDFVYRAQWPGMPYGQSREQLQRFGEEVMPILRMPASSA